VIQDCKRARTGADKRVPLTSASWIVIGMSIASDSVQKKSYIDGSETPMVAPRWGG
jgi:hypothetical protein